MSHWGGVGNLFGAGALHAPEKEKESAFKSRPPFSARVHVRSREHWIASCPSVHTNVSCTNRTEKVAAVPSVQHLPFDPFSISLGNTQMEFLSASFSSPETARHMPMDYTDVKLDHQEMVTMVHDTLKARGADAIAGIRSKFRRADKDGSLYLEYSEFHKLLTDQLFIHLSDENQKDLFEHYDKDGSGHIDYEEFLVEVRGPMSSHRKSTLKWIFDSLDKDKSGAIDMNDLIDSYNPEDHPDVKARKVKPVEQLKRFIRDFDVGGVPDGKVTMREFENYYAAMSAGIDSDQQFEQIMKSAWNMKGSPPIKNTWDVIRKPSQGSKDRMSLKDAANAALFCSLLKTEGTAAANAALKMRGKLAATKGKQSQTSSKDTARHRPQVLRDKKEELLGMVRDVLKKRGATHIAGIRSRFRRADKNNTQTLDFSEFRQLLTDQLDIHLAEEDVYELFQAYDADCSGVISYEEFLAQLHGDMNSQRQAVLNEIFDSIDKDHSGVVDVKDFVNNEVKKIQAMKRFMKIFDVEDVPDLKISRKQFQEHYAAISAVVDSDRKFVQIMKSAWNAKNWK